MTSSSQQLHTSAVNALHCVHNYTWLNTIFGEKEHKDFQKLSLKMPKRALLIFEGHFNSKDSVFIHQRFCVNTLLRMELFQSCKHLQSYRGNNRTDKRG